MQESTESQKSSTLKQSNHTPTIKSNHKTNVNDKAVNTSLSFTPVHLTDSHLRKRISYSHKPCSEDG